MGIEVQYLVPRLLDLWRSTDKKSCSDPGIVILCGRSGLKLITPFGRGGGGYSPKPYRYVPSQRIRYLVLFGLKTGIHFARFGPE